MSQRSVLILGTRGIPAAHGGFETFAEQLSLFLVGRGWHVAVYCQHDVAAVTRSSWVDVWKGVERINIQVSRTGPQASLEFDWHSIRDAARRDSLCLVLGYNTAVFLPYLRMMGRTVVTNMDGVEWRRQKWNRPVRAWFWINEWIAAWTSHHLIADHPAIADHLATRRSRKAVSMITYGGVPVDAAALEPLTRLGLSPDRYFVSIARIEPENNTLGIIEAFTRRPRGCKLVVLGTLDDRFPYHRAVKAAVNHEVLLPGPIYDADSVHALRFHARAYMHGHTVGGTNPSLVEALWAGNAVIAHDNVFNRWTAGDAQFFFSDVDGCDAQIETVLTDCAAVATARSAARQRAAETFEWRSVLEAYEQRLMAEGGELAPAAERDLVKARQP